MLMLKEYPPNSTVRDSIRSNYVSYTELIIKIPRSVLSQVLLLQMIRVLQFGSLSFR